MRNAYFAQMECNGKLIPSKPYNVSATGGWLEPYLAGLRAVSKMYGDSSVGLSLDDVEDGGNQGLFFNFSNTEHGGDAASDILNPRRNGIITLNINWAGAQIEDNVYLIIYLQWDNIISVDSRKAVILDFIP
jgi:hypothetical protein